MLFVDASALGKFAAHAHTNARHSAHHAFILIVSISMDLIVRCNRRLTISMPSRSTITTGRCQLFSEFTTTTHDTICSSFFLNITTNENNHHDECALASARLAPMYSPIPRTRRSRNEQIPDGGRGKGGCPAYNAQRHPPSLESNDPRDVGFWQRALEISGRRCIAKAATNNPTLSTK